MTADLSMIWNADGDDLLPSRLTDQAHIPVGKGMIWFVSIRLALSANY
jgi:hypothetical protein